MEDSMSRSRLWAVLAALALVIGALALAACGDDDDEGGTDTAAQTDGAAADLGLIEEGQLLVGTDTPFPPFEIGQPPDITGFDIEVVDDIARRLDLRVTYQDTSFDTIFRDLAQGRFDLVVAASTITAEREQTVDFSDPYYRANQALVAPVDSEIRSVDDLEGVTVGAQDGTTGETYANDETPAAEVRGFPEGPDSLNALRQGQVDAVIIDEPVAEEFIEQQPDLEIVQIPTGELYGLPVAEDNDTLREQVNAALAEMKDDGTLARLYQEYFRIEPPPQVLEGTNELLE
jgi:polar amino acid transport system substrate-binding protein